MPNPMQAQDVQNVQKGNVPVPPSMRDQIESAYRQHIPDPGAQGQLPPGQFAPEQLQALDALDQIAQQAGDPQIVRLLAIVRGQQQPQMPQQQMPQMA